MVNGGEGYAHETSVAQGSNMGLFQDHTGGACYIHVFTALLQPHRSSFDVDM